jgi:hypothetical protein
MTPIYRTGDTDVLASNDTISSSASSASTNVTDGTSGETYAVRVENGSTNLEAGVADAQGAVTISFTSSLPTGTNTTTYEIFVRRPTSTGGDGSTYTATNDTFTVTRSAAADNPNPNAFIFPDVPAATEGAVTTSDDIDLEGMDIASTVTALNNCSYKIDSGSWQTTTGTAVPANSQITIRTTASSTYDATVTASVTVGTRQSTTWSVTTRSDPGTVEYGLQVMNAGGTNEIFGYNVSTSHIIAAGSVTVDADDSVTVPNIEGMLVDNAYTVGIVLKEETSNFVNYNYITVTRGTNSFTLANSNQYTDIDMAYIAYRY